MKVIGTKTGGYAIFGSATSGGADMQLAVFGAYQMGGITDRVAYEANNTCDNLCDSYINVTIGDRKSPVRFVDSKPSWWADSNTWRQSRQLVWNEMENGALVLKTPIGSGDSHASIYSGYGNDYEVPSDTLTIGGKSYTVNIMELG